MIGVIFFATLLLSRSQADPFLAIDDQNPMSSHCDKDGIISCVRVSQANPPKLASCFLD